MGASMFATRLVLLCKVPIWPPFLLASSTFQADYMHHWLHCCFVGHSLLQNLAAKMLHGFLAGAAMLQAPWHC
jgi:hypothetical protein